MILSPKKTKFRKSFKRGKNINGIATSGTSVNFGTFGLKAIEGHRITARQIESARKAINNYLRRAGKLWIRIFPDLPISKKPVEVRMGGGKGSVEYWACPVKAGRVLFELDGVDEDKAKNAFIRAAAKLPLKTKFVKNRDSDDLVQ